MSLQTDYLNLDSSSYCGGNNERENIVHTKCTFCGGANNSAEKCFKRIRKEKGKSRIVGDLEKRRMERTPRKCFRCGYEDNLIAQFPKPQKKN